jgi:hypothetical protein
VKTKSPMVGGGQLAAIPGGSSGLGESAAALGRGSGGSRSTSKAAGPGGVGLRSGRAAGLRGVACLETGARVHAGAGRKEKCGECGPQTRRILW